MAAVRRDREVVGLDRPTALSAEAAQEVSPRTTVDPLTACSGSCAQARLSRICQRLMIAHAGLDQNLHFVDATEVSTHRHAAAARRSAATAEGRDGR